MLSKKQKVLFAILGIVSVVFAAIVAIPFRTVPFLAKIENILNTELIIKLVLGIVAVLFTLYPLIKKYKLINACRENSRAMIICSYFPIFAYACGSIINIVYQLSFDYLLAGVNSIISPKVIGIDIVAFTVYAVLSVYLILRIHNILIKIYKIGNIIFDAFTYAIIVCLIFLNFRINNIYNKAYSLNGAYYLGNVVLFVILIAVFLLAVFGIEYIVRVIRKDTVMIFFTEDPNLGVIKKRIYDDAYNDILDDYEYYYDDNAETYENLNIEEAEEDEDAEPIKTEYDVEQVFDDEEEVTTEFEEEQINAEDSEELKKVLEEKAKTQELIDAKKQEISALEQKEADLESIKEQLREARERYETLAAEISAAAKAEAVVPKKQKKFVPSFEKVVDFANSFSDHEGFRTVANSKGNVIKFYIGKKMFLVLQATRSDYRVNFINTPEKFVEYLTSRPGELSVPKNLKDNSWIKLTNKGKGDSKLIRTVIKEAVQTADMQIADEKAAKLEARRAKARARAAAAKQDK